MPRRFGARGHRSIQVQEIPYSVRHAREEQRVPLYHFDLVNRRTIADQGGEELSDDIAAMDSAETIARRLIGDRPDLKNRHYSILVTDEDGDEVCRLPLDIIH
jgi:hypothetical protein